MLPEERLASLYEQVKYLDRAGIEGALVECGVWKGGAVGLMALATGASEGARQLHLFDSFTDICEPNPEMDGEKALQEAGDPRSLTGELRPMEGAYDSVGGHGTVDACNSLIVDRIGYPRELVNYHIGWFQDTLPEVAPSLGQIALLRLDGDWYDSTKVCLEHLFDLVVPGGFVVVDDYGVYEGCSRAVNDFLGARQISLFLNSVDACCGYFIKQT